MITSFKRLLLLGTALLGLSGATAALAAEGWYDGQRWRALHEDTRYLARLEYDRPALASGEQDKALPLRPVSVRVRSESSARSDKRDRDDPRVVYVPVYRDQPRGAMRVAIGGVVLRWAEGFDPGQQAGWLAARGLKLIDAPEGVDWVLVASEPGLASVQLAKTLHESAEVRSASPNWWRPTSKR